VGGGNSGLLLTMFRLASPMITMFYVASADHAARRGMPIGQAPVLTAPPIAKVFCCFFSKKKRLLFPSLFTACPPD
jgi:hypothetical protein